MSRRAFNLAKLRDTGFEDASRYELDKAYELKFGRQSPPSQDMISLRAELVRAWTPKEGEEVATAAPLPTSANAVRTAVPLAKALGKIPNLRTTGRWDGRARRVTIHAKDQMSKSSGMKVGWEGVLWTIAYEQTVDMPWPYWQSLKNTDFIDDRSEAVTEWVKTEDGRLEAIRTPRAIPTVRYTDHGDVPGTEDLPVDYSDFFRRQALKTDCFKALSRSALTMVYNFLFDPEGAWFFRDMRDDDIRLRIASRLGPEVESLLVNEMYDEQIA